MEAHGARHYGGQNHLIVNGRRRRACHHSAMVVSLYDNRIANVPIDDELGGAIHPGLLPGPER